MQARRLVREAAGVNETLERIREVSCSWKAESRYCSLVRRLHRFVQFGFSISRPKRSISYVIDFSMTNPSLSMPGTSSTTELTSLHLNIATCSGSIGDSQRYLDRAVPPQGSSMFRNGRTSSEARGFQGQCAAKCDTVPRVNCGVKRTKGRGECQDNSVAYTS